MKYWVYKDSRVLGPYDREAFAGLPGVDSSTLVSVGDAGAGEGDWKLAGEIPDLAALGLERASWAVLGAGDIPSTQGMLDRLQIDAAGLVGDEDFPAGAEELFQDADLKKGFADLLAPRPSADEAELRRAKDRATELAFQVEALHKRLNDLETSRAELMHRLAEHEAAARAPQAAPPPAPAASLPSAPAPVVLPPIGGLAPGSIAAAPPALAPLPPPPVPAAPVEPPAAPAAPVAQAPVAAEPAAPALPDIPALPSAASTATPAPPSGWGAPVGVPGLPSLPSGAGTPELPPLPAEAAAPPVAEPAPPAATPRITFGRKNFKIVPTRKSFRVIGADEPATPAPEAAAPALPPAPAPLAVEPPAPAPLPVLAPPPAPEPVALSPAPAPAPAPAADPFASLAPPATMTFAQPFAATPAPAPEAAPAPVATPSPSFDDLAGAPPVTMQVSGGASAAAAPPDVEAPSADAVLARLAKPSAPPTAPPAPRPRNYKAFYIAGALLVLLLGAIGFMFRTPKDVSDMATLDDGRPRVGAEDGAQPEAAPPPMPAPAPAPAPAAPEPTASQPDTGPALNAAVELVKGFPLDGDRGTVGAWLQYSYSASADAGREVWSANAKGDDLFLVEYKVEPAPNSTNAGVFYLFEADVARRLVMGKNPEARQMLAGAPPPVEEAPKPRPKPKAKARPKARPRPVIEEPKEVPLLPLPGEGELRPPAEDDGAFGSDTVGGGI